MISLSYREEEKKIRKMTVSFATTTALQNVRSKTYWIKSVRHVYRVISYGSIIDLYFERTCFLEVLVRPSEIFMVYIKHGHSSDIILKTREILKRYALLMQLLRLCENILSL